MTLNSFIKEFDNEKSFVLLEGKRNILEADKKKLFALGKMIAMKTKKIIFRSGNAEGADEIFCDGVSSVDKERLQIITPYSSHRKKSSVGYETFSLDEINVMNEPEVVYQSKQNKKMEKLIDNYVSGGRDRFSIKAAYILRDTVKVIGTENILPASFGIFYDDLKNPMTGGTGHTMNVCIQNKIPFINQTVWFNWLKKI